MFENMPEIPGVAALGNVDSNDFTGSPLDLVFMSWTKMGPIAFYGFVAYAFQLVFFAVLGMGWSWGYSHNYSGGFSSWRYTPHMTLGSSAVRVKAGQRILVHYDTTVGKGCLRYYLSPFPLGMPYHTADSEGSIGNGSGDVALVSPVGGWVSLNFFPAFGCNAHEVAELRDRFGQYQEMSRIGYKLSWRTDLTSR